MNIKLKADKFVNDKKLKLNYIKPKDLKLLLAEFCEEQIAELKAECDLAIEGRDVQIQELERKLKIEKELSNRLGLAYREYEQLTKEQDEHIVELETRCNELFLQTCEQAEKIKELNAEIENDRDLPAIAYMQGAEKQKKKDEEELQKWKDEWQEQVQKATDEGYARTLQTIQLTKATEIIKKFLLWENDWHDKTESKYELLKQAEQFIKDSEVEK